MAKIKPTATIRGKREKRLSTQKPALSPAHRAVVDAWFANGCVSKRRALMSVGYSEKTSTSTPQAVFGRQDVIEEIARRRSLHAKRKDLTEQMIVDEYRKMAFSNLGDLLEVNEDGSAYMDFNLLTPDQKAAMAEFQVETYEEKQVGDGAVTMVPVKKSRVKFHSKIQALDSLSRIMGLFKDKVEVSGALSLVEKVQQARARLHAEKDSK